MVTSIDLLRPQVIFRCKGLVVQQSATRQNLPPANVMKDEEKQSFWTRVLKELDLESPGRDEAIEKAKLRTQEKKKRLK